MQLAAVDLGSNSFRLEIGRVEGAQILRQNYWKETVRLAAGLDQHDRLSHKAIEVACECLARMNERLRGMRSEQVRAVGTQALRVAANVDTFLLEAQHALGFPIEVISGREEARLTFEGCMHNLPLSPARRLVIDVGGASTEAIIGRGFAADSAESFKVGCVGVSMRFFRNGLIDRASFRRAVVACSAEIEEAVAAFSRSNWDEAYGSSGTAGAVSEILRTEGWTDGTITSEGLLRLRQGLLAAGDIKRVKFAGLKGDRQEVIAGGVAVLTAAFDILGITEMKPARGALRVGLLYDLLGRRESRDLRDSTVERLQQRFAVDRTQAQCVAHIAVLLHEALNKDAPEEANKRLAWAGALHELGFAVSHNDYHKHGAYLIEHGDLPGFSTSDQERIATLVLGQRGNLKKIAGALEDATITTQVLALRLAVILCHARRGVELPRWTLQQEADAIEVGLDGTWLASHPLTQHLLEEEASQWEKMAVQFKWRTL